MLKMTTKFMIFLISKFRMYNNKQKCGHEKLENQIVTKDNLIKNIKSKKKSVQKLFWVSGVLISKLTK